MSKNNERDVREAIQANAAREREALRQSGKRDPGQEATERVWKDAQRQHDAQQRDKRG